MALTKIKGQNFRVLVDGAAVAEATSCQVGITGNTESARTKDTEGSYDTEQMVSRGWTAQVDSLQATAAELKALITMFNSDASVTVGWDHTAGGQNRVAQEAAFARSGQAHLIDLSINAPNRANVTVTCQYQGTGALS